MSDLTAVEAWAGAVLAQLEPGQRRQLARAMGTDLARSQRSRIKANLNPDGSAFEPRKPRTMRDKKGSLRRQAAAGPMFAKLARARELGVLEATGDRVAVGFRRASSSAIARVHQFGLVDLVSRDQPGSPRIRYPARRLLGLTDGDRDALADRVLAHVSVDGR